MARSRDTRWCGLGEGDLLEGRYRIELLVKARTAGAHFEATDLTNGARVSVHMLAAPGKTASADVRATAPNLACHAFIAGARCAKVLCSPHVARVLDAGVTDHGHPWIVREHLGSDTLAAHLRKHGAIALKDAVDIVLAVCDAIAEAHSNGLLHGSLGPHAVHAAWSASGLVDVKVTGAGTAAAENTLALGTTRDVECILRAPEHLVHGSAVDARADVWSIGVLLYTMIAGAAPFSADTPSGASLSVVLDEPPPLTDVPRAISDAVLRALAKDPANRQRHVLDFAQTVARFASQPEVALERISRRRAGLEAALSHLERAPTGGQTATPHPRMAEVPAPRVEARSAPLSPRDAPTCITRRPKLARSAGRRALEFIGIMTAAASVVMLVLVGTQGLTPRTARARTAVTAPPPPPSATPTVTPPSSP